MAIPALFRNLHLTNTIVTLDALGCQQAIARQLLAQQVDYALALKGNKGCYYRTVKACSQACRTDRFLHYSANCDTSDCRYGCWVRH